MDTPNNYKEAYERPAVNVRTQGIPALDLDSETLEKIDLYHVNAEPVSLLAYGLPNTPFENGIFVSKRPQDGDSNEVYFALGKSMTRLTHLPTGSSVNEWIPCKDAIYFTMDYSGNELWQLHTLLVSGEIERLTSDDYRYMGIRKLKNEEVLVYSSTKRNGKDYDLYLRHLRTEHDDEIKILECKGAWTICDWSNDGSTLLIIENLSSSIQKLYSLDISQVFTDEQHVKNFILKPQEVILHPESCRISSAKFQWDSCQTILVALDAFSDFANLVEYRLNTKEINHITTPKLGKSSLEWDVVSITASLRFTLLIVNENAKSKVYSLLSESDTIEPLTFFPRGVIKSIRMCISTLEVAVCIDSSSSPGSVYTINMDAKTVSPLNDTAQNVDYKVQAPLEISISALTHQIPAFLYMPPTDIKAVPVPVVIYIHGGPASQYRPTFLPSNHCLSFQYLTNVLNIAVIAPNVRGSSGYGKTWMAADDGLLREQSVE